MPALIPLLRAAHSDPASVPAVLARLEPSALATEAAAHGLAGVVRRLAPPSEALTAAAVEEATAALAVRDFLERVLDALAAVDLRPVLLKGYGFAARYYPEPLLRFTRDVDLLLEPTQAAVAERALERLGLRRGKVSHGAIELVGPLGTVDLHLELVHAFGVTLPPAPLLARARPGELLGRPVRYLDREDELLYLSVHAANHLLQRLAWLYDLRLLCEDPALHWPTFELRAGSGPLGQLAWFALEAAHRLLGARVPGEVLARLAPSARRRRVARAVLTEEGLSRQALWGRRVRWALVKAALSPGPLTFARWSASELWERIARPAPRG